MLVADTCPTARRTFSEIVARSPLPLELITVDSGPDCRTALAGGDIDIAFIAVDLPGMIRLDAVEATRRAGVRTFITLMAPSPSTARQALEHAEGIHECLIKPLLASDVE